MNRRWLLSCLFYFSVLFPVAVFGQEDQLHLVVAGEDVVSIAKKYQLTPAVLQNFNLGADLSKLKTGQRVMIPKTYAIKAGDTVFRLAKTWHTSELNLLKMNNLDSPAALKVGRLLAIPEATGGGNWPVLATPARSQTGLKAVSFNLPDSEFRSIEAGTVVFSGDYGNLGKIVLIQNSDKLIHGYGKFQNCELKLGQKVQKGQVLGKTSTQTPESLIFFAFKEGKSIDPLADGS